MINSSYTLQKFILDLISLKRTLSFDESLSEPPSNCNRNAEEEEKNTEVDVEVNRNVNRFCANNVTRSINLTSGHTVHSVPSLYTIVSKSSVSHLQKQKELQSMVKKFLKNKKFNFQNKVARILLTIGLIHCPRLSHMGAEILIACLIGSILSELQIDYSPNEVSLLSPSRNSITNLIEESAVDCYLELQEIILDDQVRVFLSSDHGNKKGLHHLVKYLSWFDFKRDRVRKNLLDTDATGGTSKETAEGINKSLTKLDKGEIRVMLHGNHGDAGGGGTGNSLVACLVAENRIHNVEEYLFCTCALHGMQLCLANPVIKLMGEGGIEQRNLLQILYAAWNLQEQFEFKEFQQIWFGVTGDKLTKQMKQLVLTRWEYYISALNYHVG